MSADNDSAICSKKFNFFYIRRHHFGASIKDIVYGKVQRGKTVFKAKNCCTSAGIRTPNLLNFLFNRFLPVSRSSGGPFILSARGELELGKRRNIIGLAKVGRVESRDGKIRARYENFLTHKNDRSRVGGGGSGGRER